MINDTDVDWRYAGEKFSKITAEMIHGEASDLRGDEFYGEALRRLFTRWIGRTWITEEEHQRLTGIHRSVDRNNLEQARRTLAHHTGEYQRKLADARKVMADTLRSACNERTVPARYRREGVLLAADWLDGTKSPYGGGEVSCG